MKDGVKLATAIVVAVFIVTVFTYALQNNDNDERPTLEATIVQSEHGMGLTLDVTLEDLESIGAYYGCDLDIAFGDSHYTVAFVDSHNGVANYSIGLTYSERYGGLSISLSGGDLTHETGMGDGSVIKIKVKGDNEFYKLTPNYRAGSTDKRADYDDDQKFGNYRELKGGNLKDDTFYRSSNPWNHSSERAQFSDDYYRELGVENLISFDLTMEKVQKRCEELPDAYATSVYEAGKVHASALSPSVFKHPDQASFVLESILDTEGTVGMFCTYGKDRTGAYCAMIEALAGASYEEIRADFMESMCNYYHFEKDTPEYEAVAHMYIDRVLWLFKHYEYIDNYTAVDWSKMSFDDYVPEEVFTEYLINVCGVPGELIDDVKERITA